jgi:predicted phage baseplate assembly protein
VPDPKASKGGKSTLRFRVGGVLWNETDSLYGKKSKDLVYVTRVSDDDELTIRTGDGTTGSRLPSGTENITATYRHGLGKAGNVDAGAIKTLLDRPKGLKSAYNPQPAKGGTDPESMERARVNAPNTVRTFDRAISLRDYEDLARGYNGIAKAKAGMTWENEEEVILLTIAGDDGVTIEEGDNIHDYFSDYLDNHRDPNHTVRILPHGETPIYLEAIVQVDPTYRVEDVVEAAEKAVMNYFDFDNLQFGEGIHKSDVYAVLQKVEGVTAVKIEYLYDTTKTYATLGAEAHIAIDIDKIAVLKTADMKITADFTQGE